MYEADKLEREAKRLREVQERKKAREREEREQAKVKAEQEREQQRLRLEAVQVRRDEAQKFLQKHAATAKLEQQLKEEWTQMGQSIVAYHIDRDPGDLARIMDSLPKLVQQTEKSDPRVVRSVGRSLTHGSEENPTHLFQFLRFALRHEFVLCETKKTIIAIFCSTKKLKEKIPKEILG